MDIYERLFELMNVKNIKAVDLANHLNISKSVVSNWKTRGTNPPSNYLVGICELLEVSISYLVTGQEETSTNTYTEEEQNLISSFNTLNNKQRTVILGRLFEYEFDNKKSKIKEKNSKLKIVEPKKATTKAEIIPIEKILLPVYPQRASAGIGKYMLDDDSFEEMEFDLDNRTQKADHAIIVDGDSMYPTIENGDYIFVREQQTVDNNEVGVFVYEDNVYCKRLHIDYKKKQLTLLSDNEDYADIPIKNIDNLRTIGKVIL